MLTIGVRELKARLSQILREVQRGEVVLVTDRGRVVAEMRQPGLGATVPESPEDRALARLAAEGHVRLAEPKGFGYPRSPIRSPDGTALELLREERGE
ncbi:MAG TPA: type II toxin-antitoxin system prevent-host-death family antitoxin, partial [Gemmatimonadales bacterium]|nr:type II toxin-antitoxin system prevent-host-death family antitoxin [Gemmatimonadales bacterium]